jgi:hypothetical protein
MKFKLALTSLFFLSNCVKYESPIFYFHNVSDRILTNINCVYKDMKFKFESLGLASPPVFDGVKVNSVKLFSFDISSNREFYGKMVCQLRNFKGEIKKFKFEVKQDDIELPEKRHFITKTWLMPAYLIAGVIFPSGVGKNRKIDFFIPHVNIYLSQNGYEILLSNDENYFKKDNFYIEIMQKNGINYTREKTLNKNLNY